MRVTFTRPTRFSWELSQSESCGFLPTGWYSSPSSDGRSSAGAWSPRADETFGDVPAHTVTAPVDSFPPGRGDCVGYMGTVSYGDRAPTHRPGAPAGAQRSGAGGGRDHTWLRPGELSHPPVSKLRRGERRARYNRVREPRLSRRFAPDRPLLLGKADQRTI